MPPCAQDGQARPHTELIDDLDALAAGLPPEDLEQIRQAIRALAQGRITGAELRAVASADDVDAALERLLQERSHVRWCDRKHPDGQPCAGPVTELTLDGQDVGLWLGTGGPQDSEPVVVIDGLGTCPALPVVEAVQLAQALLEQVERVSA